MMPIRSTPLSALLLSVLACGALAGTSGAAPTGPAPDWFLDHVADRTAEGGRWHADNSVYREQDGGIDTFVLRWIRGPGDTAMTGRLYGLRAGNETATFWEFRVFWHPGDGQARVYQFGAGGAVGIGVLGSPDEDGLQILEQAFFSPDGGASETRHETRVSPGREVGTNFALVDGEWVPQRTYTWVRDPSDL